MTQGDARILTAYMRQLWFVLRILYCAFRGEA